MAAGLDARRKLQELAAHDLGGAPADYDVAGERVFRWDDPMRGLRFGQAADRAVELGGRFDGHELPEDINSMTVTSATALTGRGLIGVAKDTFATGGLVMTFVVGFAEVEVDVETGKITLMDYVGIKGIGEPAIGAGSVSVLCAVADALGSDGYFFRSPVTADMVLTRLEEIAEPYSRLMSHV